MRFSTPLLTTLLALPLLSIASPSPAPIFASTQIIAQRDLAIIPEIDKITDGLVPNLETVIKSATDAIGAVLASADFTLLTFETLVAALLAAVGLNVKKFVEELLELVKVAEEAS
ncbi:uncharacterized protein KY384_005653 [Bacidia gigantensis]|uniref:uncharacterized protein n=1 Tax=Bacidia gigantensis TaxID=2732470 RepID=UPI001D04FDAC|nr:uncharacterized protein KY384_005653 [Bacidia gigantensis]KAG8530170.1 hypothetical protein KY384_005653 [Bacidia gigantensis]